jgi:hypothetical protein
MKIGITKDIKNKNKKLKQQSLANLNQSTIAEHHETLLTLDNSKI